MKTIALLILAVAANFGFSSCANNMGEPGSRHFGNPKTEATQTSGTKPSDGR